MLGTRYARGTVKVTPILGTLRKQPEEETHEVPDPYPVTYDTEHKY
jgi:hypothetical protein